MPSNSAIREWSGFCTKHLKCSCSLPSAWENSEEVKGLPLFPLLPSIPIYSFWHWQVWRTQEFANHFRGFAACFSPTTPPPPKPKPLETIIPHFQLAWREKGNKGNKKERFAACKAAGRYLKASEENAWWFYPRSAFCFRLFLETKKKFHIDFIHESYFTEMLMSLRAKRERPERFVAWMPEAIKGF